MVMVHVCWWYMCVGGTCVLMVQVCWLYMCVGGKLGSGATCSSGSMCGSGVNMCWWYMCVGGKYSSGGKCRSGVHVLVVHVVVVVHVCWRYM